MTDTIHNTILPMTDTTAEPEDYTGEDGLLYCGKCRKPKEAYFLSLIHISEPTRRS